MATHGTKANSKSNALSQSQQSSGIVDKRRSRAIFVRMGSEWLRDIRDVITRILDERDGKQIVKPVGKRS